MVRTVNSRRKLVALNGASLFNNMPAGKWAKSGRITAPERRDFRNFIKSRGTPRRHQLNLNAQQRRRWSRGLKLTNAICGSDTF